MKGNFKWKDGKKEGEVEFVPDSNGKWEVVTPPDQSEINRFFKADVGPTTDIAARNYLAGLREQVRDQPEIPKERRKRPH